MHKRDEQLTMEQIRQVYDRLQAPVDESNSKYYNWVFMENSSFMEDGKFKLFSMFDNNLIRTAPNTSSLRNK